MVSVGKRVDNFTLPATGDQDISLSEFSGRNLVIYFYPKDNTPGCTREGQDFRDLYQEFTAAGADILGVSRDSVRVHGNFRNKHDFPFHLLSDADEVLCKQFDVIREKKLYGRTYMGIDRSTFLIDGEGVLRHEWRKVRVPGHAQAVLDALKALD
ncbi:MAG: peroxiredoxin [Xanthomonadales bacterium]|nr:peroxiredoxin [Gammaproteobacteria bacterium]MBT8072324.1 peroxiredoxin [Gammaproteobacteria bacterium]NNK03163.1 peroxiredoxin [Xanthomonadales bacterium]